MLDVSLAKELWRLGFRWTDTEPAGTFELPSLGALLAELERYGFFPELSKEPDGRYRCILYRLDPSLGGFYALWSSERYGETWEDAVGRSLFWAFSLS